MRPKACFVHVDFVVRSVHVDPLVLIQELYLSIALEYDPNNSRALQHRAMLQHNYLGDFRGAIADWLRLTHLTGVDPVLQERAVQVPPCLM